MIVFYLSTTAFADNQINLIHHFSRKYTVIYSAIIPVKNSNYTEDELAGYCKRQNISFLPFRLKHRFRDPRVIFTYYKIISVIRSVNPDVIFVANFDQIYLNMLLVLLGKRKTIIAMHDVVNHSNTAFDRLTTLGKKILFFHFQKFLTYSALQAAHLKKEYPQKEVFTIPLPLIGFGSLPAREDHYQGVTFLFFGNILPYKGLDILLNAVNRLAGTYDNFRLLIAGRSTDWEEVYQPLVNGNKHITAHIGFIENKQIPWYFSNADYVVLPYRDTTQSGPLMIAYNYNVPVIASSADGFNEFFKEGHTGYRFDLNAAHDLDRVLAEAIERKESDYSVLKQKLSDYTVQHFSISKLARSYEDMFDTITESKHAITACPTQAARP